MSIRRILTILVIAAAAFAALYVFYWIYVSGQIKEQTLAWAEDRRAEGYAIELGRVDVNGFPAAFEVQVTDFAIGAPNNDWSAATRALADLNSCDGCGGHRSPSWKCPTCKVGLCEDCLAQECICACDWHQRARRQRQRRDARVLLHTGTPHSHESV